MKPSAGIRIVREQLARLESATLEELRGATKLPEYSLLAFLHAAESQGLVERRKVARPWPGSGEVAVWRLKR